MEVLFVTLGVVIVFCVGFVLTAVVTGKVAEKIEAGERKRTGLIPPVDKPTLDARVYSAIGGIGAVVLALILFYAIPREAKGFIWSIFTLIVIVCGVLAYVLFRPDNGPVRSSVAPPARVYPANPKSQSSKDRLYQSLLMKTKNDRAMANRLIEYERRLRPDVSEEELIKGAIERWELDNNRW